MSDTMQSLDQLSQLKPAAPEAPKYVKKVDKQGRAYATGKRKDAVARVWIKPGSGKIVVNTREVEVYFARPVLRMMIQQPIVAAARQGQYDVICTVAGGGLSGQAGAVRHGISKALTNFEPDLRSVLKKGGFLTRDSRVVERKKYGKAKARRSFQFSKRLSFRFKFSAIAELQGRLRAPFLLFQIPTNYRVFSRKLCRGRKRSSKTPALVSMMAEGAIPAPSN